MRLHRVVPLALVAVTLAAAAPAAFAATAPKPAARVPKHGAVPAAVPFLDDDLPKAIALAKQSKRPVFVEAWAPW